MRYHPYIRSRKGETMTDSNDQWITIDPIPVSWDEPGMIFEGAYIGVEDKVHPEWGPYQLHTLQPFDIGAQPILFTAPSMLKSLMATVVPGDHIKVIYEGWKEDADPRYKVFTLQKRLMS